MSIQSSLNQGISLASLLASQNPQLQELGERNRKLRSLKAREDVLKKELSIASPEEDYDPEKRKYVPTGREAEVVSELKDIAAERFHINPTEETYAESKRLSNALHTEFDTTEKFINRLRERMRNKKTLSRFKSMEEAERIRNSRDFARMITEGVPDLSFDPSTYTPPERR